MINWRDIRNPEAGGAEVYYHEIFRRLAASGHYAVTVLSHGFRGAPRRETVDGLRVIRTGSRLLFNFAVVPWVRKRQAEYDLIVEDLNKVPFFTPLYTSRPRLHLAMHFFGRTIFREISFPMASYIFFMEQLIPLAYRSERFVAISPSTREEIRAFRTTEQDIAVVEPGIDLEATCSTATRSAIPTMVYFGRIKKYKNIDFILHCLRDIRNEVPDTRLEIAGGGEYAGALRRLAVRLGVQESVVFHGFVSEEVKLDLLGRAHLVVNPSVKEGWGITNIEANRCGTATLCSNVAGLRDSVRDGETGLLFEPGSRKDFVSKAVRILTDQEYRRRLEKQAFAFAGEFGWDGIARKMDAAIRRALP